MNEFLMQDVYEKFNYDEIVNRLIEIFLEDSSLQQGAEAAG